MSFFNTPFSVTLNLSSSMISSKLFSTISPNSDKKSGEAITFLNDLNPFGRIVLVLILFVK
jgi:hypothetical protein